VAGALSAFIQKQGLYRAGELGHDRRREFGVAAGRAGDARSKAGEQQARAGGPMRQVGVHGEALWSEPGG